MTENSNAKPKRSRISQSFLPNRTLEDAVRIANALWKRFGGKPAAPDAVAKVLEFTPASGSWRNLAGAAVAYGLTTGGYNAPEIALTDIGRAIAGPKEPGEVGPAKLAAAMKPELIMKFVEAHDRRNLPEDQFLENWLVGEGIPRDRVSQALDILKQNLEYTGMMQLNSKGRWYISRQLAATPAGEEIAIELDGANVHQSDNQQQEPEGPEDLPVCPESVSTDSASELAGLKCDKDLPWQGEVHRVFVSHGDNKEVVALLKRMLTYGRFEPVVSIERETTAKSVPEKVFQEMRQCQAAVIHVCEQGVVDLGNDIIRPHINDNVLIEIGAALVLYGKRVVLLVRKGLELPSNLQGLYRCEYEGENLNASDAMKLLEAFENLRQFD